MLFLDYSCNSAYWDIMIFYSLLQHIYHCFYFCVTWTCLLTRQVLDSQKLSSRLEADSEYRLLSRWLFILLDSWRFITDKDLINHQYFKPKSQTTFSKSLPFPHCLPPDHSHQVPECQRASGRRLKMRLLRCLLTSFAICSKDLSAPNWKK